MRKIIHQGNVSLWLGLAVGVLYGVAARFLFTHQTFKEWFLLMNIGFIFVMPLTLGVLTVYFGTARQKRGWAYWIFMPWLTCVILLAAAFLIGWEGSICILMALPIFLLMSSLGGVITGLLTRRKTAEQNSYSLVILFVFLPFVTSAIENQFGLPESIRTVDTQITINASPQTVWENIARVKPIRPDEQRFSMFHLLGFPRPVEATLSHEGLGGVRHATFEGGVLFVETIDKWEREQELSFGIKADSATIPPTTLDEHVTVGGPYFDMLEGTYKIERLSDKQVVLHLSSKHRLSTRFNSYGGQWTDYIMRDIQENILGVIKRRCETVP
jgi:hypothetical protein